MLSKKEFEQAKRNMVALFQFAYKQVKDVDILITACQKPYACNGGFIAFNVLGEKSPRFYLVYKKGQYRKAMRAAEALRKHTTQTIEHRLRRKILKVIR